MTFAHHIKRQVIPMRPLILVNGNVRAQQYKEFRAQARHDAKANGMKPSAMRYLIIADTSWSEYDSPDGSKYYEKRYVVGSRSPNVMMVKVGNWPYGVRTELVSHTQRKPNSDIVDLVVEEFWFGPEFFDKAVIELNHWLEDNDLYIYGFVSEKRMVVNGFFENLRKEFPGAHHLIVEPVTSPT